MRLFFLLYGAVGSYYSSSPFLLGGVGKLPCYSVELQTSPESMPSRRDPINPSLPTRMHSEVFLLALELLILLIGFS